MDLLNLPEKEINDIKKQFIEKGIVFERKKINSFNAKYFETVTISNTLIKFFLFFSMSIYILINLAGIITSFINNTSKDPIGILIGLFVICFIGFAIFSNINTNKKKEENTLYIKEDNFIFNFSDGAVETPNLFYSLPYDSIKKIEFIIHRIKKGQIYGGVTFTFNVLGYNVYHIIRYTNLSEIEKYIKSKFPTLMNYLVVDGKGIKEREIVKDRQNVKYNLISLAILVVSILLIAIPYALNYNSVALIISAIILFITAIIGFLSGFLYTYHLVQGEIISGVFIIIGICVPLLVVEMRGISLFDYILQDTEILLPTFFGIIGLCMYAYIIAIIIGKIIYKVKNRKIEN